MSGWLNLCNTVPDSSRPGNRPILKFTKYVYQVLTYYKAGRNLSETRLSSDVCRDSMRVWPVAEIHTMLLGFEVGDLGAV